MYNKIFNGIRTHICTQKENNFPRQIGFPKQREYYSIEQVLTILTSKWNHSNCYSGVYSKYQITNEKYDKIFVDIDYQPNLQKALNETKVFVNYFNEIYNIEPRVYFTANKGFAVYIDIKETEFKSYIQIPIFIENIVALLDLKYVDIAMTKDKRRISRLPYSINHNRLKINKTPLLCVPVNVDWSLNAILKESKCCKFKQDIVIDQHKLLPHIIKQIPISVFDNNSVRTCISELSTDYNDLLRTIFNKAPKFTDGRHRLLMYIIIPILVHQEYSDAEIFSQCNTFLKNANAVVYKYSSFIKYHINRNKRYGFKPTGMVKFLMENPDLLSIILN